MYNIKMYQVLKYKMLTSGDIQYRMSASYTSEGKGYQNFCGFHSVPKFELWVLLITSFKVMISQ